MSKDKAKIKPTKIQGRFIASSFPVGIKFYESLSVYQILLKFKQEFRVEANVIWQQWADGSLDIIHGSVDCMPCVNGTPGIGQYIGMWSKDEVTEKDGTKLKLPSRKAMGFSDYEKSPKNVSYSVFDDKGKSLLTCPVPNMDLARFYLEKIERMRDHETGNT